MYVAYKAQYYFSIQSFIQTFSCWCCMDVSAYSCSAKTIIIQAFAKTKQIKTNYYWTEGNSFSLGSVLSVVPKMVCVSGNFFSGFVCCLEEFMHFMLLWHSLQLNPLSCWHCLYLAILFICHHLV